MSGDAAGAGSVGQVCKGLPVFRIGCGGQLFEYRLQPTRGLATLLVRLPAKAFDPNLSAFAVEHGEALARETACAD